MSERWIEKKVKMFLYYIKRNDLGFWFWKDVILRDARALVLLWKSWYKLLFFIPFPSWQVLSLFLYFSSLFVHSFKRFILYYFSSNLLLFSVIFSLYFLNCNILHLFVIFLFLFFSIKGTVTRDVRASKWQENIVELSL